MGEPILIMMNTHFGNLMVRMNVLMIQLAKNVHFFIQPKIYFFTGSSLLITHVRGYKFENHGTYLSPVIGPETQCLDFLFVSCCQVNRSWHSS